MDAFGLFAGCTDGGEGLEHQRMDGKYLYLIKLSFVRTKRIHVKSRCCLDIYYLNWQSEPDLRGPSSPHCFSFLRAHWEQDLSIIRLSFVGRLIVLPLIYIDVIT
jgi:hypothetical protein